MKGRSESAFFKTHHAMRHLDLTLPSPEENLALDEALLEEAEDAPGPCEVLRTWEPERPMVVVGRSSRIDAEVHLDACRELGFPVLRRASGGAAIVAGPGCLMYAVVLSYERLASLRRIDQAHRYVLNTLAAALHPLVSGVRCRGISDLVIRADPEGFRSLQDFGSLQERHPDAAGPTRPGSEGRGCDAGGASTDRKFSGNSVRCRRRHLLYHGTLLYDFPLDLVARCLKMPPRQPDYRDGRQHGDFLINLPVPREAIRRAVVGAWRAGASTGDWPHARVARLVAERYGCPEWHAG